jgi:serine protease Do
MKPKTLRAAVFAALIPAFLAGCSASTAATQAGTGASAPAVAAAAPVTAGAPDFTHLVVQSGPAVVNISVTKDAKAQAVPFDENDPMFQFFKHFGVPMPKQAPMRGIGSGFIVSPDGYILTNAHVVDGVDEVHVKLTDRREFNAQWVVAMGSPFGFENSVTAGIVSAKSRSLPGGGYVPFIQTDVAVNPGNSGGPLFDLNGDVIGINSQIYSASGGYMGLSFAIPIDVAMQVKDALQKYGHVTRGRIGVAVQNVNQSLAQSFGLPKPEGALVSSVDEKGPAKSAGIKAGDVILAWNGTAIDESSQLPVLVAETKPGERAQVKVWRNGAERTLGLTVGTMPDEKVASAGEANPNANSGKLGLMVQQGDDGLVVQQSSGPAAAAGVQPGDVILGVNDQPVKSVSQLRKAVERAGKHVALLVQRGDATVYVPVDLG